jgi:hypothetical protein
VPRKAEVSIQRRMITRGAAARPGPVAMLLLLSWPGCSPTSADVTSLDLTDTTSDAALPRETRRSIGGASVRLFRARQRPAVSLEADLQGSARQGRDAGHLLDRDRSQDHAGRRFPGHDRIRRDGTDALRDAPARNRCRRVAHGAAGGRIRRCRDRSAGLGRNCRSPSLDRRRAGFPWGADRRHAPWRPDRAS